MQPVELFHYLGGQRGNLKAGGNGKRAAWRRGVSTMNSRHMVAGHLSGQPER